MKPHDATAEDAWPARLERGLAALAAAERAPAWLGEAVRAALPFAADLDPASADAPDSGQDFFYPH